MIHKIFVLVILTVLPISLYSQNPLSLYDINGWSYVGAWGVTDMENTGMRIEEGLSPSDSIQYFNSCGWTTQPGGVDWVQENCFGKFYLPSGPYPLPQKVLIDCNIIETTNVSDLVIRFALADTTNGGYATYLNWIPSIVPGWQTIELTVWGTYPPERVVSMIAIQFALFTTDSTYTGIKIQTNNLRFVYDSGDTILVDKFGDDGSTAVEPIPGLVPSGFVLEQNYPNPFNPTTTIQYEIPEFSSVKLTVYNLLGEEVAELVNSEQQMWVYEADFNASGLSSGTYIYILQTGTFRLERKMIVLK